MNYRRVVIALLRWHLGIVSEMKTWKDAHACKRGCVRVQMMDEICRRAHQLREDGTRRREEGGVEDSLECRLLRQWEEEEEETRQLREKWKEERECRKWAHLDSPSSPEEVSLSSASMEHCQEGKEEAENEWIRPPPSPSEPQLPSYESLSNKSPVNPPY